MTYETDNAKIFLNYVAERMPSTSSFGSLRFIIDEKSTHKLSKIILELTSTGIKLCNMNNFKKGVYFDTETLPYGLCDFTSQNWKEKVEESRARSLRFYYLDQGIRTDVIDRPQSIINEYAQLLSEEYETKRSMVSIDLMLYIEMYVSGRISRDTISYLNVFISSTGTFKFLIPILDVWETHKDNIVDGLILARLEN